MLKQYYLNPPELSSFAPEDVARGIYDGKMTDVFVTRTGLVYNMKGNIIVPYIHDYTYIPGSNSKHKTTKVLPDSDGDGYCYILARVIYKNGWMEKKMMKVHRLVAFTFIPNPDPEHYNIINHKSGVRRDNSVENLEWCTIAQNTKHAVDHGLLKTISGEDHVRATFTNDQVHVICKGLEAMKTSSEIIEELGLPDDKKTRGKIAAIKCGQNWKHISCQYDIPQFRVVKMKGTIKYTDDQIRAICQCIDDGMNSSQDIAKTVGITGIPGVGRDITLIRNGRLYKRIAKDYEFYKRLQEDKLAAV